MRLCICLIVGGSMSDSKLAFFCPLRMDFDFLADFACLVRRAQLGNHPRKSHPSSVHPATTETTQRLSSAANSTVHAINRQDRPVRKPPHPSRIRVIKRLSRGYLTEGSVKGPTLFQGISLLPVELIPWRRTASQCAGGAVTSRRRQPQISPSSSSPSSAASERCRSSPADGR
jgi:hypothetical protein